MEQILIKLYKIENKIDNLIDRINRIEALLEDLAHPR